MKKFFLLFVVIMLIYSISFAKVWRVNNRDGVNADFTTAQAAHDGASAGDTLYFEHSTATYGDLIMTKGLKLFGTGYFLQAHPQLQYSDDAATLSNITLKPTATRAQISVNCNIILDSANGLKVIKARVKDINLYGASNTEISECYIIGQILLSAIMYHQNCSYAGCSNILIRNNILLREIYQQELSSHFGSQPWIAGCNLKNLGWVKPHSVVAFNNTIVITNITPGPCRVTGSYFNNVSYGLETDATTQANNNVFVSNFYNRNYFLNDPVKTEKYPTFSGDNNLFSKQYSSIFKCYYTDSCYIPIAGSAPIGAGTAGSDAGAFGGISPYKLGLPPVIPAIYKLATEPTNNANTIKITVSTRINN